VTTVDRLIESTQELLWERGYVGTSPRAIQQRAGAGQGSMYHHFAGKPDLALAALQRNAAELTTEAAAALDPPGTAQQRIAAYLTRERDVLRGCRIGRLAADPDIVASPTLRKPVEDTFDWLCAKLADIIADGKKAGEFPKRLNPTATAATIAAVVQGGYVLARAANSTEPFDRAIAGVIALLKGAR
jgi:TetR/AcrR family transcriptional regulator, transcriptional repressor for nem operon